MKILKYNGDRDIATEFIETWYKTKAAANNIRRGTVKDMLFRSIYGVGFIGGGKYKTSVGGIRPKAYRAWSNMIKRCYDKCSRDVFPTYEDVTVLRRMARLSKLRHMV